MKRTELTDSICTRLSSSLFRLMQLQLLEVAQSSTGADSSVWINDLITDTRPSLTGTLHNAQDVNVLLVMFSIACDLSLLFLSPAACHLPHLKSALHS